MTDYTNRFIEAYTELQKAIKEKDKLQYFKSKLIKIIENKEQENNLISKSYGVGKLSTYADGSVWRKVSSNPSKWKMVRGPKNYNTESHGSKIAVGKLKKEIQSCKSYSELLSIVVANKNRFVDNNGRYLPIVKELMDEVNKTHVKQKKTGTNTLSNEEKNNIKYYENEIKLPDWKRKTNKKYKKEIQLQKKNIEIQTKNSDLYLKAPNGEKSNLTKKQWVQVRTPNFLRWFGNWNYDENKKCNVTELKSSEFLNMKRSDIADWLISNFENKEVEIDDNMQIVDFKKGDLKASIKNRTNYHDESYSKLNSIIKNSLFYNFEKTDEQGKHKHLLGQDIYYSLLKIGNDYYSVMIKLNVNKYDLSTSYKDHKNLKIDKVSIASPDPIKLSTGQLTPSNFTIGQLTNFVKPKCSKMVDKNGEPMIIYHGSKENFDAFQLGNSKAFFFTDDKESADFYSIDHRITSETYGKKTETSNIKECYLNLQNPFIFDNQGEAWNNIDLQNFMNECKNQGYNISLSDIPARMNTNEISELLKKSGLFDGVIIKNVKDGKGIGKMRKVINDYVVFNPEQIKSAINNDGAFSPIDNSINKSFTEQIQEILRTIV